MLAKRIIAIIVRVVELCILASECRVGNHERTRLGEAYRVSRNVQCSSPRCRAGAIPLSA